MSDSDSEARVKFAGFGLLEFTYRFTIVMLDKGLLDTSEAVELLNGVGNALEHGRVTPGILNALEGAMRRSSTRSMN